MSSRPLFLFLVFLFLALGCGSFAPRPDSQPTPWPTATPRPTLTPTVRPANTPTPDATEISEAQEPTPIPEPTATATPPGDIIVGQAARIVSRSGVNIRSEPATTAARAGFFSSGALVLVLAGPEYADGFVWWQVDNQYGKAGWVAGGDGADLWLSGNVGDPRPVNRAVRNGDQVTVTVRPGRSLAVRYEPRTNALIVRRVVPGTKFAIIGGPVTEEGFRWWRVQRADGLTGWAAESDSETRWLTPIE